MQNKIKKTNSNKILGSIFLFAVLVYIFFFTSNLTMGKEDLKNSTELNKPISFGSCNVTIESWKYSQNQELMEIELDIDRLTYSNILKYDFIGYQKDMTAYTVDRIVDDKDYLVLHIEPVPKDFKEFTLQFTLEEDSAESSILNLRTNVNDIEYADEIKTLSKIEYIQAKVKRALKQYNSEINQCKENIKEIQKRIASLNIQILEIEEQKKYLTASELQEAESQISEINSTIEDLTKEIGENNVKIQEFQAKIQKSELKLTDLRDEE